MAYYQVLNTDQGNKYNPGFMQNVNAVTSVLGKQLNKNVFQDAAAANGLVPEYQIDSNGNTQISYKSPQLINRGFYTAGAPGNPTGKPTQEKPQSVAKAVQDMLAGQAVSNATTEAKSYGPGLADNLSLGQDDGSNSPDGVSTADTFSQRQAQDPTQIFQAALAKQAASNPIVAKSLGVAPVPARPGSKHETVDQAIMDASAGNRTFADVYRQFPTKIKQIQQARAAAANLNLGNASSPDNSRGDYVAPKPEDYLKKGFMGLNDKYTGPEGAPSSAAASQDLGDDSPMALNNQDINSPGGDMSYMQKPVMPIMSDKPGAVGVPFAGKPADVGAQPIDRMPKQGAKYYSPSTKKYYDAQGNEL